MTNFQNKLDSKLKDAKPIPRIYFQILHTFIIIGLGLLLFVSSFGLGFWAWDLERVSNRLNQLPSMPMNEGRGGRLGAEILSLPRRGGWEIFSLGLYEVLIIGGVSLILFYLLYRTTDLPLVKHRKWVIVSMIGVVILGAGISYFSLHNNPPFARPFEKIHEGIQGLPHRRGRVG